MRDTLNLGLENGVEHHWFREVLQDMALYAAMHGFDREHLELSRLAHAFDPAKHSKIPEPASADLFDLASYRLAPLG